MTSLYTKFIKIASRTFLIQRRAIKYSSIVNSDFKTPVKEFISENKIQYIQDPDTFGNLSIKVVKHEDEGDIQEEQFLHKKPLKSQKLTTKQYADLIKEYIKYKRIKEAIDVLEVRMIKVDQVKPENYIYNILIGACADVGYTKKAFKLFNDMKRRALKPTGDTYTCLFEACSNSPWSHDGLKNAKHLRELMIEKGIEPNVTNYNAMIKAFGRCGDLVTAFQLIDEMKSKKIKVRVHTLNHLLHACITDKGSGLRHAILVWRKMLQLREKPNIYSFNLMLKCVRECNIGDKENIKQIISSIEQNSQIENHKHEPLQLKTQTNVLANHCESEISRIDHEGSIELSKLNDQLSTDHQVINLDSIEYINNEEIKMVLLDKSVKKADVSYKEVPNLLSKNIQIDLVVSIKDVNSPQERFAIVGGIDGFLKEMTVYSVKPDIKTFTQMLPLIEDCETEMKILEIMKSLEIKTDIDFFNMLIKNRCFRKDYDGAFDVLSMIKKESEFFKKRYLHNKKIQIKKNIITYGVLALACKSKEKAKQLLAEMKEEKLKPNIEIFGTLLRHGTTHNNFPYVIQVLNWVKDEQIMVNHKFLEHLENFNEKCLNISNKEKSGDKHVSESFIKSYRNFSNTYTKWIKDIDVDAALQPEHPWAQFKNSYPETFQHTNMIIKEPKKFYKRNRKYVQYRTHQ